MMVKAWTLMCFQSVFHLVGEQDYKMELAWGNLALALKAHQFLRQSVLKFTPQKWDDPKFYILRCRDEII